MGDIRLHGAALAARSATMLAEYEAGFSLAEIGARHGISRFTVQKTLSVLRDYRPRRPGQHCVHSVAVPSWVQPAQRGRFRAIAAANGEEVAAGCMRRMKALEARP